jgi:hypothetical protein
MQNLEKMPPRRTKVSTNAESQQRSADWLGPYLNLPIANHALQSRDKIPPFPLIIHFICFAQYVELDENWFFYAESFSGDLGYIYGVYTP